jgi:hypothetical protein
MLKEREKFNPQSYEESIIKGVSPDTPIVENERGGAQSKSPYRLDLIDPKAILETAKVLAYGAERYGDRPLGAENWRLISIEDHLNHLLVHVYAYLAGDRSDGHLSHAVCRALFALGVELETKTNKQEEDNYAMVSNGEQIRTDNFMQRPQTRKHARTVGRTIKW